jgi:mRNA interferase MazF
MEQVPRRREIWLAKIPFSDFSGSKVRPFLIMSRRNYNEENPDVVGVAITTHVGSDFTIPLTSADFDKGMMMDESAVRYDGLIKIDKSLLHKRIARVNEDFRKKINEKIIGFIE